MDTVKVVLLAIVGVGMATALTLPDRKTPDVIRAAGQFFSGGLGTAMGLRKG